MVPTIVTKGKGSVQPSGSKSGQLPFLVPALLGGKTIPKTATMLPSSPPVLNSSPGKAVVMGNQAKLLAVKVKGLVRAFNPAVGKVIVSNLRSKNLKLTSPPLARKVPAKLKALQAKKTILWHKGISPAMTVQHPHSQAAAGQTVFLPEIQPLSHAEQMIVKNTVLAHLTPENVRPPTHTIHVPINPPHLGPIHVVVQWQSSRSVRAHLMTNNMQTAQTLQEIIPELSNRLVSQGVPLTAMNVVIPNSPATNQSLMEAEFLLQDGLLETHLAPFLDMQG